MPTTSNVPGMPDIMGIVSMMGLSDEFTAWVNTHKAAIGLGAMAMDFVLEPENWEKFKAYANDKTEDDQKLEGEAEALAHVQDHMWTAFHFLHQAV